MNIYQYHIGLQKKRGFHLITEEILEACKDLSTINAGFLQVFIQHTSASLCINENADPTVRKDFETYFNAYVPENMPGLIHTYEGADDMPAHIKSTLLGSSVQIPITKGQLALGTWQGIYLCEHRNYGGQRNLVITIYGV